MGELPSARELLLGLVGRPLATVGGAVNTVLDVGESEVMVATDRSPGGSAVPIGWVQQGLDLLARDGEVEVHPDALEHRSTFVGAVLLTLPGTSVVGSSPPRIVLPVDAAVGWDLEPGQVIRRRDLHDRLGGSRQGGMTTSSSTPNILLFLDRAVGNPHGYFDGWAGDRLYYTGHGQRGDQEFRAANAATLDHHAAGKSLRVFRGAGGPVCYLGEFEVDEAAPYFRVEAPESESGATRQVIVFRLAPVGTVVRDPQDDLELPALVSVAELDRAVATETAEPLVTEVPIENQYTEEVTVAQTTSSYTAVRREQKLVLEYTAFLERQGSTVSRFRVRPPGEARELICDLYDKTRGNLVEAKGSGARGEIRMAIGQLLDYGRFIAPPPAKAILLPARPRPDLEALLAAADVAAIWPSGAGFQDNADGRFV